jgi:transposase
MSNEITELVKILPILKNAQMEFELMNYHEYIIDARKKKYTYKTIENMLKENGITVSMTTLQRFIRSKNAEKNNIHP